MKSFILQSITICKKSKYLTSSRLDVSNPHKRKMMSAQTESVTLLSQIVSASNFINQFDGAKSLMPSNLIKY